MKATTYSNGLRAYVAFVVVIFISMFLSCCEEPLPPEERPLTIPTIITNTIASVNSETSVIIEVSALIKNNGGTPLLEAGVCWSVGSSPTIESNKAMFDITKNELGDFSAQFSDFKEGIVYRFKAYALNKIGVAYGEEKTLYLSPHIYQYAEVWPAEAENITLTSATLSAFVIPNEPETELFFEFAISGNTVFSQIPLAGKFSGSDTIHVSVEVSDLEPGRKYDFRLKAINPGREIVSAIKTFDTYAVADYDGNLYKQVLIGNQIWLTSNLKTTHYANGDPIPNVKDEKVWAEFVNLEKGAYVWYDNDESYKKDYGALYNFYVGVDKRELIPGWHVPSFEEWGDFDMEIRNGVRILGIIEKEFWEQRFFPATYKNIPESQFNSTGFSARPGGFFYNGFGNLGKYAYFWTSSKFGPGATAEQTSVVSLGHGCVVTIEMGGSIRLMKNE